MRLKFSSSILGRFVIGLSLFCGGTLFADDTSSASAGFLFDHFKLTLEAGQRTEAAGPFFYSEHKPEENTLAFPPFYSRYDNPSLETREYDVLYPLFSLNITAKNGAGSSVNCSVSPAAKRRTNFTRIVSRCFRFISSNAHSIPT